MNYPRLICETVIIGAMNWFGWRGIFGVMSSIDPDESLVKRYILVLSPILLGVCILGIDWNLLQDWIGRNP